MGIQYFNLVRSTDLIGFECYLWMRGVDTGTLITLAWLRW